MMPEHKRAEAARISSCIYRTLIRQKCKTERADHLTFQDVHRLRHVPLVCKMHDEALGRYQSVAHCLWGERAAAYHAGQLFNIGNGTVVRYAKVFDFERLGVFKCALAESGIPDMTYCCVRLVLLDNRRELGRRRRNKPKPPERRLSGNSNTPCLLAPML